MVGTHQPVRHCSLEELIGPACMSAMPRDLDMLDPDGRFRLSTEAREDLTEFVQDTCNSIGVRIRGPHDEDIIRAVILHGHGFPGLSVQLCLPVDGARRLRKLTHAEAQALREAAEERMSRPPPRRKPELRIV